MRIEESGLGHGAPRALALTALLAAATAVATGCFLIEGRNDPDTRAVAAVTVDLSLVEAAPFEHATGRLFLRLMAGEGGEAVERDLEWAVTAAAPAGPPLSGGSRGVEFRRDRSGLEPGLALFDDLKPGRYRVSSFLVSARLEPKDGEPSLLSLSGELRNLGAVTLEPGVVADLGVLAIALSPGGRYEYRLTPPADPSRLGPALAGREDLRPFRIEPRKVHGQSPVREAKPPAAARRPAAAFGAAGRAPKAEGDRIRLGTPPAGDVLGAPDEPWPGPSSSTATPAPAPEGRARPSIVAGEPRPGSRIEIGPEPAKGELALPLPAPAAGGSRAVFGLAARLGAVFAGARGGSGIIEIEFRRVGQKAERSLMHIGWEVVEAPVTGPSPPAPAPERALKLVAPGTIPATPDGLTVPLDLAPGEHELVTLEVSGRVREDGRERGVAARLDTTMFAPFPVRVGELVDLGTLVIEIAAADRLNARVDPTGAAARADALAGEAGATPAGASRRSDLVPVSRPFSREPHP